MMAACKDFVALLGPFADGELAAGERAGVQEHLGGCAGCRLRVALLSAQGAALRERTIARAAGADLGGLADRVLARVLREAPRPRLERLADWRAETWAAHRAAFAAAGSLALAACLALAVFLRPAPAGLSDAGEAQQAEIVADAAQPQVDEVDFGSHDGAVLQLRDKTPVIWLGEDRVR